MTTKTMGRNGGDRPTQKTSIACNHTGAKGQRGEIEALIVASLMLTAGAVALIVLTVAGWLK